MTCRPSWYLITLLSIVGCLTLGSCYSLKGYSINQDVITYNVGQFKITAYSAPATINQTFAEALKDKISRESRLKYTDGDADIEFQGAIQTFVPAPVAPLPNEQVSFNRLTISVNIEYTNHKDEKDHWTKTFSHFADFPADQNLLQVQDDLIKIIFDQILEDVFNQAFNNW